MKNSLALVAALAALAGTGKAATLRVDKESGNDARAAADATLATPFATIQGAVDAAPDGSTILVEPGVYDTGNGDPPGNGGWGFSRVGWANRKLILKSTRGQIGRAHV